jgi:hypothetical protein
MEPTDEKLIASGKKSRLSRPSARPISVSIKTLEAEPTASSQAKALRLFCRAMIRLYLKNHANHSENGKSLGVL